MSFIRTAVIGTNALSQLFGGEQPVGFDDGAFAMHPFGFDGIEPGTLFGQKQRENAHAFQIADSLTKRAIVEQITTLTGYHRVYARRLLNHPEAAHPAEKRSRPRQYGPEVQHVLFLAWHAANHICPKRLIPCVPT